MGNDPVGIMESLLKRRVETPLTYRAGPYVTQLTPEEEKEFQAWVAANKVPWQDVPNADYDMRGYWKAMKAGDPRAQQDPQNLHFPDIWKTPYHQTFSNESVYALPDAPSWKGSKLVAPGGAVLFDEMESLLKPKGKKR